MVNQFDPTIVVDSNYVRIIPYTFHIGILSQGKFFTIIATLICASFKENLKCKNARNLYRCIARNNCII